MSKKKIDKTATIENILKKAEGHIKDADAFKELMQDEQDILDACIMWEAEVVYLFQNNN